VAVVSANAAAYEASFGEVTCHDYCISSLAGSLAHLLVV
jgi:hypothetical protein